MDLFSHFGLGGPGFPDLDAHLSGFQRLEFPDWFAQSHFRPVARADEGARELSPGDEGLLRYLKSQPEMNGKMALVQRATCSYKGLRKKSYIGRERSVLCTCLILDIEVM